MDNNVLINEKPKLRNKFWDYFGKIAAVLGAIWILIQIWNFLFKDEFSAQIKGNHFSFELPKFYKTEIDNYEKKDILDYTYEAIYKNQKIDSKCFKNVNEIQSYFDELQTNSLSASNKIYDYIIPRITKHNFDELSNIISIWDFSIENSGKNPIEDIILEIPFQGVFKAINSTDNIINNDSFDKKIKLGTLRPGYQIQVRVWRIDKYRLSLSNEEDDQNKTFLTHKNGKLKITYPLADTRFSTFVKKHELISIYVIGFIFLIGYIFGVSKGLSEKVKEGEKGKSSHESQNQESKDTFKENLSNE